MQKTISILLLLVVSLCQTMQAGTVESYPLPSIYSTSNQMSVVANAVNIPVLANTAVYEYAHFSFSGEITITVTASENITSYTISPLSYNIPGTVNGKTLTFTLTKSRYLIVKINSLKYLVIAADQLEEDKPASTGAGIYNVLDAPYNADKTGAAYSTSAIQTAINDANTAGGGIVYVPAGVYKCANLILKSNISLYLEGGSVIRGSGIPADYSTHFRKDGLSKDGTWFIYTDTTTNTNNIKVYGRGTIDGNGLYMRNANNYLNNLLVPLQTSHFTVDGIILKDGGLWSLIPTRSDHVIIQNTKHFNENDICYENDAIDIIECQNVNVRHTIAISEDDTYSTKTWSTYPTTDIARYWPGKPEPLSDVVFDDCVGWSRCATFKLGDGTFQSQTNVQVKNSVSYKSMRAISLHHFYGTTTSRNITFDSIDIEGFWPRFGATSRWFEASITSPGPLKNVIVKNINVRNVGNTASSIQGYNAANMIDSIRFENIFMPGKTEPATTLAQMNITNVNGFFKHLLIVPTVGSTGPDTLNLALNKPALVSSEMSPHLSSYATDGNDYTRWGSSYANNQWLYVDLGEIYDLDSVKILWEVACGKNFDIQVSDNATDWTTIKSVVGNTSLSTILKNLSGAGRYVRMNGLTRATAYGFSIFEFSVYGRLNSIQNALNPTGKNADIVLYPNPVTEVLTFKGLQNAASIKIFNTDGTKVKAFVGNIVNIRSLPAGIYFAKINTDGKVINRRFVKK